MMDIVLNTALALLALSVLAGLYRLVKGPSRPDRIAALDMIGILLLSMIAVTGMRLKTLDFADIVLVIGILTFIGTAAMSRYIERGVVLEDGEHERHL